MAVIDKTMNVYFIIRDLVLGVPPSKVFVASVSVIPLGGSRPPVGETQTIMRATPQGDVAGGRPAPTTEA